MQWSDVMADPSLRDLPYKIELNEYGKIVMTPSSKKRGNVQAHIARKLWESLKVGEVITECSVETDKGVKVADVAWCSLEFIGRHGRETPYTETPEICVEILSPSNSEREMWEQSAFYFARGAEELWILSEAGETRVLGLEGYRERSRLAPDAP